MLILCSSAQNYEPNHLLFMVCGRHNDLMWWGVGGSVLFFIGILLMKEHISGDSQSVLRADLELQSEVEVRPTCGFINIL